MHPGSFSSFAEPLCMGLTRNALLNPYLSVVALLSYADSGRHAAGAPGCCSR
jgi:hypothetical protein